MADELMRLRSQRERVRQVKIRLGQKRCAFASMLLSAVFIFAAEEDDPAWQGARGPWRKIGPRRYQHADTGEQHRVGSLLTECILYRGPTAPPVCGLCGRFLSTDHSCPVHGACVKV